MITLKGLIPNLGKFKILIADHEASARRVVRKILRAFGLNNIREAESGEEALEKLRAEDFDFVISAYNMPGMDGLHLLWTIKNDAEIPNPPFILITEKKEEERAVDGIEAEGDGCVSKPIKSQTLEDKMVAILFDRLPPSPLDLHLQAAGVLMAKNDFIKAHDELDQAAGISPRSPIVSYFRHLVFTTEGRPEKADEAIARARNVFKRALIGPREARRQIKLGKALLSEGQIEGAKKAFKQAVKFDPENPEHKAAIGEAFLAQGMALEAENAFKDYLEANPEDIFIYNRLGIAFRRQKKLSEAITYYKKAVAFAPFEENLLFNLSRAYFETQEKENAIKTLKTALDFYPDFQEARDLLNKIHKDSAAESNRHKN